MQKEAAGIETSQWKIQILGFVNDLNIVGKTRDGTEKAVKVRDKSANKIGLKLNENLRES